MAKWPTVGQWWGAAGLAAAIVGPAGLLWALGATPRASCTVLTTATTWRPDSAPEVALVAVLALAAWAVLGWLAVGVVCTSAAHLRRLPGRIAGSLADRIVPVALRRVVNGALGVTLATAVVGGTGSGIGAQLAWAASPSVATAATASASAQSHGPDSTARTSAGQLDWPAARSAVPAAPVPGPPAPTSHPAGSAVVVTRGDTLWGIAARHLDAGADVAAVAREWPRWFAANRQVIGANPNLLLPGQRLAEPPPQPSAP